MGGQCTYHLGHVVALHCLQHHLYGFDNLAFRLKTSMDHLNPARSNIYPVSAENISIRKFGVRQFSIHDFVVDSPNFLDCLGHLMLSLAKLKVQLGQLFETTKLAVLRRSGVKSLFHLGPRAMNLFDGIRVHHLVEHQASH